MSGKNTKPDPLEVYERYLDLRRSGKDLRALCPFHAEKTPSFFITPGEWLYYCFGCGAGGDVIKFVQEMEQVSFTKALQILGMERLDREGAKVQRAIDRIQKWRLSINKRLMNKIREAGDRLHVIRTYGADEGGLCCELEREWVILTAWQDALFDPDGLLEMYQSRDAIERIVA